jgi:hypothetical protein
MNILSKLVLTSLLGLPLLNATAGATDCSKIKAEKSRLQCYDANARATATAHSSSEEKGKAQIEQALKALRKISSATSMGISQRDYSQLVAEQAFVIDEALREAPDSAVKSAIAQSKDAYIDARTLWGDMYSMGYVSIFAEHDRSIYMKYENARMYMDSLPSGNPYAKSTDLNMMGVLNPVWNAGKSSLTKAEQLAAGGHTL